MLQFVGQAKRRRRKRSATVGLTTAAAAACGELVARNPAVAGGMTAFAIVLAYVSANALWYQPQALDHAFLETRPGLSFHAISRPPSAMSGKSAGAPAASAPKPDPTILKLQTELKALGLYDGPVDGIDGPRTEQALEAFRKTPPAPQQTPPAPQQQTPAAGSGGTPPPAVAVPRPRPAPPEAQIDSTAVTADIPHPAPGKLPPSDIVHIQAGLKAFGNDGIHIDGVVGTETRNAIREFQALFHMPVTGEADAALLAKMRDVGLIN